MVSLGISGGGWTYDVFGPDEDDGMLAPWTSFIDLWRERRGDGRFPAWRDFDIMDFADWWGWLSVRDILATEPLTLRYRLWGTQVTDLYGVDLTNRTVASDEESETARSVGLVDDDYQFYRKIVDEGLIGLMCGEQYWRDRKYVRYGSLCVPLADDGATADKILAATYPFEELA